MPWDSLAPAPWGIILHYKGTRQGQGYGRQGRRGQARRGSTLKSRPSSEPGATVGCAGFGVQYPVPECDAGAGKRCSVLGESTQRPLPMCNAWCAAPGAGATRYVVPRLFYLPLPCQCWLLACWCPVPLCSTQRAAPSNWYVAVGSTDASSKYLAPVYGV